jgi:hypothetical protein
VGEEFKVKENENDVEAKKGWHVVSATLDVESYPCRLLPALQGHTHPRKHSTLTSFLAPPGVGACIKNNRKVQV